VSVLRASVSQTALYALLPALGASATAVVAYPSAGIAKMVLRDGAVAADVALLRKRVVDADGALVIESGLLALRREAGVWGDTRGDFGMMQRLKAELDPKRVLNPGRFVGGI
jgi:glycolate oxidase FAD binding subunit